MKAQMQIKREGEALFSQKDANKWRTGTAKTKDRQPVLADAGRWLMCVLLIGILAVSGMSGANVKEEQQTSAAPVINRVMHHELPEESATFEETITRLDRQRKEELAILEAVAGDALTDEATKKQALEQRIQIAARLEAQSSIEEALAHMGYVQSAAICTGERVVVIMPSDTVAQSEMVHIIDAICSVSGCDAKDVKIILAKK